MRKGCCLCESLEQKLAKLPLDNLHPPLDFFLIDIDAIQTPKEVKIRYDLVVPVLAISSKDFNHIEELPRVSPRIDGQVLFNWLQKTLAKIYGTH